MRLRHSDWNRVLAAIAHLYSDIEPTTLGERALAAVNKLVSGDVPAFNFFDARGFDTGKYWNDPNNSITDAQFVLFSHVAHEHPFIPDMFGKGRRDAMKTTDFLSPAQFRRTSIYNEFYRLFPIHYQLSVAVSPHENSVVTCTTNRKTKDFTEEDRAMFDLLAPHLSNAIRNGQKIARLLSSEANLNSVVEAKSSGVFTLGPDGKIARSSPSALRLIEKYFGHKEFEDKYLPERLLKWVEKQHPNSVEFFGTTGGKYVCELADSKLSIASIPNGNAGEVILVLEEIRNYSPMDLVGLGMTKRQTEVLFWMSRGKTDRDIASLLGISHRTVHKHTENIYLKLGVETRTAAVLAALEKLRMQ